MFVEESERQKGQHAQRPEEAKDTVFMTMAFGLVLGLGLVGHFRAVQALSPPFGRPRPGAPDIASGEKNWGKA